MLNNIIARAAQDQKWGELLFDPLALTFALLPLLHPGTSISNALSSIYHPQPEGQTACGIPKCWNGCVWLGLLLGKSRVNRTQVAKRKIKLDLDMCIKEEVPR